MKSTELRTLETRSFSPIKTIWSPFFHGGHSWRAGVWKEQCAKFLWFGHDWSFTHLLPVACQDHRFVSHQRWRTIPTWAMMETTRTSEWTIQSSFLKAGGSSSGMMLVRPRVLLLGIFSVALCNKYFYLCSHRGDLDYPALKKSNLIHSLPLRQFQVHNVWAIELCR